MSTFFLYLQPGIKELQNKMGKKAALRFPAAQRFAVWNLHALLGVVEELRLGDGGLAGAVLLGEVAGPGAGDAPDGEDADAGAAGGVGGEELESVI